MTSKQSSVGRQIENLFCWWIPVGDRIPTNSRRLQHVADRLTDSLMETEAYVRVAIKHTDSQVRLEAIEGAILSFEEVKSLLDSLYEYCSRSKSIHFISLKQKRPTSNTLRALANSYLVGKGKPNATFPKAGPAIPKASELVFAARDLFVNYDYDLVLLSFIKWAHHWIRS